MTDGVCSTEGNVALLTKRKFLLKGNFPLRDRSNRCRFAHAGVRAGFHGAAECRPMTRRAAPCRAVLPTGTYVSTYVTRLSFVPFILTRSISLPGVAITISAPGGQRRCMLRMVDGRGRASRAGHVSDTREETI
jgi:hypothetical protein